MSGMSNKIMLIGLALAYGVVAFVIFWLMRLGFYPEHPISAQQALSMILGFALGRLFWDVVKLVWKSRIRRRTSFR
jgi:hypothetical protein